MRSIAYHQAAGKYTLARDEIQPRRGWWYAPHVVRRWYAKPAAWINKKRTFGRQKFSFCWWKQQGSNLRPHGCEPCALTNWAMLPYSVFSSNSIAQLRLNCKPFFAIFSFFHRLFSSRKIREHTPPSDLLNYLYFLNRISAYTGKWSDASITVLSISIL